MDIWAYYITEYKKKRHNNIAIGIIVALLVICIIIAIVFIRRNKYRKPCQNGNCGNCNRCGVYENLQDLQNRIISKKNRDIFNNYNEIKTENIHKTYYSDEIDPIITGNLYKEWNNRKPIYSQRTSYGAPVWETQNISQYGIVGYRAPRGLHEYNSDSNYNYVGVSPYVWRDGALSNQTYDQLAASMNSYDPNLYLDVAKAEYDQNQENININNILSSMNAADDGIPQNWNLPSTPIINYNMNNTAINYGRDYYSEQGATPFTADGIAGMFTPDHDPLTN